MLPAFVLWSSPAVAQRFVPRLISFQLSQKRVRRQTELTNEPRVPEADQLSSPKSTGHNGPSALLFFPRFCMTPYPRPTDDPITRIRTRRLALSPLLHHESDKWAMSVFPPVGFGICITLAKYAMAEPLCSCLLCSAPTDNAIDDKLLPSKWYSGQQSGIVMEQTSGTCTNTTQSKIQSSGG